PVPRRRAGGGAAGDQARRGDQLALRLQRGRPGAARLRAPPGVHPMIRRRLAAAALVLGTLLSSPAAWAESLADTLVGAYRHSALIEQNRAVLRAAVEDVAVAMASLRRVVQWVATHNFTQRDGSESISTSLDLTAQLTLFDWGRNQLAIDIAKEQVL